jgi:hypothetical protein
MERNTRQRSAIRDAIAQAERPLLPQEVLDAAQRAVPGLGIATVYRPARAGPMLGSRSGEQTNQKQEVGSHPADETSPR